MIATAIRSMNGERTIKAKAERIMSCVLLPTQYSRWLRRFSFLSISIGLSMRTALLVVASQVGISWTPYVILYVFIIGRFNLWDVLITWRTGLSEIMGFSYPIHPVSFTLILTPLLNFLFKPLSSSPPLLPPPRLSQFLCNLQIFDVFMTFIWSLHKIRDSLPSSLLPHFLDVVC